MYRLEWSTHKPAFVLLGGEVCSELGLPSFFLGLSISALHVTERKVHLNIYIYL